MGFIEEMELFRDTFEIVDLSHTLEEGMPAWPTQARYGTTVYESYEYGDAAIHSEIILSEHTGTHIDAPRHFFEKGIPIDELDLKTVMGRCVCIEASQMVPRQTFSLPMMDAFEKNFGSIKEKDIVIFHFGWEEKWALQPDCADFLHDWPGLSSEVASYLVSKGVSAVGCDTLSLDAFGVSPNVVHNVLLGHGIPIIENVCNLTFLPTFSYVIGLPNKFKNGSGSPIRLIAFVKA